jgi:hypothetical protein
MMAPCYSIIIGFSVTVSLALLADLKGTVSRDFLLLVFFSESVYPQQYPIRTVSNFFENSWRYSQVEVHHHRYQRHRWQILPPVSLGCPCQLLETITQPEVIPKNLREKYLIVFNIKKNCFICHNPPPQKKKILRSSTTFS